MRAIWLCVAVTLCLLSPAHAQRSAPTVSPRNEIAAALYDASATQAAIERHYSERLDAARAEIDRLRSEGASAREALAAAQEQFVAALAERDSVFSHEIAIFRRAVTDIAQTPQGLNALHRFNVGDWAGARSILQNLIEARAEARAAAARVEQAADLRQLATLALDARAKGLESTVGAIALFEAVISLDPSYSPDSIELARLYQNANRMPDAQAAARTALETSRDDYERMVALSTLGSILQIQGDLARAREAFEEALAISRRWAATTEDPLAQMALSVSLTDLSNLLSAMGEPGAAEKYSRLALAIDQRLAAESADDENQRNLALGHQSVGDALIQQGQTAGALTEFEASLSLARRNAAAQPDSITLQTDLATTIVVVGDAKLALGDLDGAEPLLLEGRRLLERIAATDASNVEYSMYLATARLYLGELALLRHRPEDATEHLRDATTRFTEILAEDPSNVFIQWMAVGARFRFAQAIGDEQQLDSVVSDFIAIGGLGDAPFQERFVADIRARASADN